MNTNETKNEGAYKAGDGKYIFDIKELKGLMAGPGYAETFGPVVEGELTQVCVMTLPAGQTSAPHFHPNEQWVYVLQGKLRATVDGEVSEVGPGHLLWNVQSGQVQSATAGRFEHRLPGEHETHPDHARPGECPP